MGAIAPINFEKDLIAPIDFSWKEGFKGNLHPIIETPYGLLGILHPLIVIPSDTPEYQVAICRSLIVSDVELS